MVTLGIIGGRDTEDRSVYSNQSYVDQQMDFIASLYMNTDIVIMSGGSKGAELLVERWAEKHSLVVKKIPPRIRHFEGQIDGDNLAFRERNNRIIGASDHLIFFWDGMIPVIKDAIQTCASFKKPSIILPMV